MVDIKQNWNKKVYWNWNCQKVWNCHRVVESERMGRIRISFKTVSESELLMWNQSQVWHILYNKYKGMSHLLLFSKSSYCSYYYRLYMATERWSEIDGQRRTRSSLSVCESWSFHQMPPTLPMCTCLTWCLLATSKRMLTVFGYDTYFLSCSCVFAIEDVLPDILHLYGMYK